MKFVFCFCLTSAAILTAQTSSPVGVSTEWDARKMLAALNAQIPRFQSALAEVKPQVWKANGAPDTFLAQIDQAQAELRYLGNSLQAFSKKPETLSLGLEAYFRTEAMITTFETVLEGVRKYQNPAIAELLESAIPESHGARDHLRQYLQELATEKETEFQVADREAQRCRETLMKQPAAPAPRRRSQ